MARLICNNCKERVAICDECQEEVDIGDDIKCVCGKIHLCIDCSDKEIINSTIEELA